jgi:hypothetical protein
MEKNYPIVEVLWRDAVEIGDYAWNDLEEILERSKEPCPLVKSVGYLVFDGEAHISLVGGFHSEQAGRVESIPKGCIEALRLLNAELDGSQQLV